MIDHPRFLLARCEVQPDLNRVVRNGEPLAVEPKIMATLVLLASADGGVVTREQLLDQVWEGAYVGDDVVTRAIGELRRVFGDDPRSPRVIETIRKRGYRLVASVEPLESGTAGTTDAREREMQDAAAPLPAHVLPPRVREQSRTSSGPLVPAVLGALAVLVLVGLGVALRSEVGGAVVDPSAGSALGTVRVYPLSGALADERDPAVSPDGTRIAFAAVSAEESSSQLVVKLLRSEARQELTDGTAADRYPSWSPDGTELAFQRQDAEGCWLATVAATGGQVRRLAPCDPLGPPRMAFSPDGRFLVVTRLAEGAPRRWALYLLDLVSLQLERITDPKPPYLGDYEPAFSPDGSSIVFARALPGGSADLWRVEVASRVEQRLTFDYRAVEGQAFAADGRSVVFASDRGGSFGLWSVPAAGGEPVWLTGTGSKIKHPSHARTAPVLAFEDWRFQIAVWRIPLDPLPPAAAGDALGRGQVVARSSGWDFAPAVSPDGTELLFTSSRSGAHELWRVGAAGGEPAQLTRGGGQVLSGARWSPDGQSLVYSAFHLGDPDLFVVARGGAVPRRLTHDGTVEMMPSWSADGRFVYYSAERDGRWQVHRRAVDGGETWVVADGIAAREAPDGSLLVVQPDRRGIWRIRVGQTEPEAFVPELEPRDSANWDVGSQGVFYIVGFGEETELRLRSFDGATPRALARIGELARAGITVAPDGSAVYVARVDRAEVELMVAENLGST
jgi:Tol biopolymer transport system component/DNA-binding winged helix-turn-helix (wHTH) protein